MTAEQWASDYMQEVGAAIASVQPSELAAAAGLLMEAWRRRARVYVCGNGGSAAIASHFAGDLNKGTNIAGRHRFRAQALVDNTPALMAWSNDEGYESGMVEQLRNFVEPNDLVVGISGSGNSANVLRALELARLAGAHTLGFCGFSGGELLALSDAAIHVPSDSMEQVEDAFSVICHCLLYTLRRCIRQEPESDNPLLASRVDAYPSE
ncbi:MAG: SIS domain-containing protein [Anaerolineae bacterium]|nr:SIS domain-containing protein [Anaerolineae bacterium]